MNYKSKCKVKSKNVLASRFFTLPADGTERQANGDGKTPATGHVVGGRTAWMSDFAVQRGLRERGSLSSCYGAEGSPRPPPLKPRPGQSFVFWGTLPRKILRDEGESISLLTCTHNPGRRAPWAASKGLPSRAGTEPAVPASSVPRPH